MSRPVMSRIVLIAAAVAAAAVLLAAVLALVNGDQGFAFCTATGRYGWIVPLVAGLAIGAVSLSLVDDRRAGHDESEGTLGSISVCSVCGGPVVEGSRMCPSCGRMLEMDVAVSGDSHLGTL